MNLFTSSLKKSLCLEAMSHSVSKTARERSSTKTAVSVLLCASFITAHAWETNYLPKDFCF